jgi:phage portal protein BeeE
MTNYLKSMKNWAARKAVNFLGFPPGYNVGEDAGITSYNTPLNWAFSGGNLHSERHKYRSEISDPLASSMLFASAKWHMLHIGQPKIKVVKKDANDEVVSRVSKHPVVSLLRRPNDFYSGQVLMAMMTISRMISGNGYALKFRNRASGSIEELWYESHYTCRPRTFGDSILSENPVPDDGKFISFYEVWRPYRGYTGGGRWRKVSVEDVIHFRFGINPQHPTLGMSAYDATLSEVYSDMQRSHFTASVLSKVGMIPFLISPRDAVTIKEKDAEELKTMVVNGARSSRGEPVVASKAIRMDKLGFSPQDLNLSALSSISEERLASCMGPNAYVLGFVPENSIFSNFVEARRDAMESYSVPTHEALAQLFTDDLLREFTLDESTELEYDFRNVVAMSEYWAAMSDTYGKLYRDGVAKRSDSRRALQMKVAEDGSDDVYVEPKQGNTSDSTSHNTEGNLPPRTSTDKNGNDRKRAGKNKGTILGGKPASGRNAK